MTKQGLSGCGLLLCGWLAACSDDPAGRTSCELARPESSCADGRVCDSSEERYAIELIDGRGHVVWRDDQVPKQSGGSVRLLYGGPALPPASLFQFRVTSSRKGDLPISQSEELRGVFQTR